MKLVVLMHNVRSVHNVGSIFRTADAVGVEKIYLCGITPSPLDRFKNVRADFAKVALGAEKSVAWEGAHDTLALIQKLKSDGYTIFALEQSKESIPYHQVSISDDEKIALILGAEVEGLPADVLRSAARIIEIPMRGKKESLNVSVAFGVSAFALLYNRGK